MKFFDSLCDHGIIYQWNSQKIQLPTENFAEKPPLVHFDCIFPAQFVTFEHRKYGILNGKDLFKRCANIYTI